METTTRTHTGKTPIPGIASAIKPGSKAHRRPRIRNRSRAVTPSIANCNGGANSAQIEKKSETAATAKAMAILARAGRLEGTIGVSAVRIGGLSVSIEVNLSE